jgi:aldehyde:ferredoxin oxidoreductase
MHGWMGKILRVNLTNSEITQIDTQPYASRFLGGRGIATRIYWETVKPEIKAFDPENRLIFMTGPLVATGVQAATRMVVVGKSPMAYPEGFCYGNIGGFTASEMKRAGFDGIIIEGQAASPVYLWVHDGEAELRDASSLWGKGAYKTGEMLQQVFGEKVQYLSTGQAGENLVRTAVICGSQQTTSCGGFGAVMGAKKLKAIAIQGTRLPTVNDREKLKELNRYTIKIAKHVHLAIPPIVTVTNHGHLLEVLGKRGCFQCGMICNGNLYRYARKLEGKRRCQSMEYYLPWKYNHEDEPVETWFDSTTLANDYSLTTFELMSEIDWLYNCYKSGALTEEETGLPLAKIGTREFLEKYLHDIAYRQGFGNIMAEGLVRVREARLVPEKARRLIPQNVAPVGTYDMSPPRAIVAHALLYPMEPRVHQPIIHEIGFTNAAWSVERMKPGSTNVTNRVFHEVAKRFWGSDAAADLSSYEGKALAAKLIQNRTYIKDSLGLCDFTWPIAYSIETPDHMGDPDLEAKLFAAVTGEPQSMIQVYAERIFNLQRAILIREGRKVPEADFPLEYNFTEPLQTTARGEPVMVPGPGEETISATGKKLDRDKFTGMLKEYYQLRGWNPETGLPTKDTLIAVGLEDVAGKY